LAATGAAAGLATGAAGGGAAGGGAAGVGAGAGAAGFRNAVSTSISFAVGSTYWLAMRLSRVGSMPTCRAVSVNARALRFSANAENSQSSMMCW